MTIGDWQTKTVIVIVCPGQGSQTPGFLKPWLTETSYTHHLEEMSNIVGIDLFKHGTTSDANTIRDTAVAQPLIVAAGLLVLRPLLDGRRDKIGGIAGHSVGEVTAATTAGILNKYDALTFVTKRGTTMAHAAALTATGMSAVIGAQHGELLARLSELGLQPANFNGAGQVVVAGTRDALAKLRENPPTSSRVIPLHVAGAFHTHYMQPAVAELTKTAAQITPHDPQLTIWTNNNGSQVSSGKHFLKLLVNQVSSPVHWDACMRGFISAGVTGIIEITPAGTLTGLAKRTLKDIPIVAINTPDDLDAARELIDTGTPL